MKHLKNILIIFCTSLLVSYTAEAQNNHPNKNPFLSDSNWPIGHTNSAQTNATPQNGPVDITRELTADEVQYQDLGQFQLGQVISGQYENGKRVIWCNGSSFVAKIDYDNYNIISTLRITDVVESSGQHEALIDLLDSKASLKTKIQTSFKSGISGLSSVYILIDKENHFLAATPRTIKMYGDVVEGDMYSGIKVIKEFTLPEAATGKITGMNMTYDGHIVVVTNDGFVVAINSDFTTSTTLELKYRNEGINNDQIKFVRNSLAVDDNGGIYIASLNHMHKIIWTGNSLSNNEKEGAWVAEYPNSFGLGTGSTPALMGFEDGEDQFVVITDGDSVMNMTLFWRNEIPSDWNGIEGMKSKRIAASAPVNFGKENVDYVQQEQGVTIDGYGMIVVNNVPKNVPKKIKEAAKEKPVAMWLFMGYMNGNKMFAPKGIEKMVWNSKTRAIEVAWINHDVSDPTCVPFVATGNEMFYTIGSRDNKFTFEGINAKTGESVFHYVIGGSRYNGFYSAPTLDLDGRILYGGLWGVVRLSPKKIEKSK
ncbi:hypothetical protein EI427_05465 [Flammeovirga pectinis]|uniref:SMP-30/Gluconolactonase/LRE-like region domain-containing protein n=1 Tax=Flammeovirga pectinis TaxID=2494373 RepID=A0A3S9P0I0_9BACT|nr:hypothetical protein [Flammeovirga pectinis]AZQ61699.1 hypothetical protein EI427_05465 [Flammeovirga pectinis]